MSGMRLIVGALLLLAACNAPGSMEATPSTSADSGAGQPRSAATSAATCDGLAKIALGAHYDLPYGSSFGPTSDGSGAVAAFSWIGPGPYSPQCHFIRAVDGQLSDAPVFGGGDETQFWVDGEDDRFLVIAVGPFGGMGIDAFTDDGTRVGATSLRDDTTPVSIWVAPIASGGAWVVRQQAVGSPMALWLDHHDSTVARLGTAQVAPAADEMLAIGVSKSGDALVAWREGTKNLAQWYGLDVTPKSAPFEVTPGADMTKAWAISLADGGVALLAAYQDGSTKVFAVAKDGSAAAEPAPDWLQARAGARLALIRGGSAYAFWPTTPACTGLELVAADGTSCGCLPVPDLGSESNVGADGSLLVPSGGQTSWYPALLKWARASEHGARTRVRRR